MRRPLENPPTAGRGRRTFALAATALASCLSFSGCAARPNHPPYWMRSQAYETAAAVAVAQSDAARNDPSLITRDFTQPLGHAEGELSVETFTPCPLTASELIGGWGPAF